MALSQALKARGCAAIHVTTGGVSPQQAIIANGEADAVSLARATFGQR